MILGTKMMFFEFLVLKIENFGFKNPYQHVLGKFGQFWKNPKFSALFEPGGGAKSGLLRIFERNFFLGPVTFPKMEIWTKILSARDLPIS